MEKFSIVMPLRDTPKERKFAEKSLPSAIALGPDEIVIGVDEPADESFLETIRSLCAQESFEGLCIIRVPKSEECNFQLANVIWYCYKACKNDRILAFDVDTVLRPAVLKGCGLIGTNGNAIVSFTKRGLIRTPSDLVRHMFERLRVRTTSWTFAGTYWLYRPYYFEDIELSRMQSISNGIDAYMVERMIKIGQHKVVTLKEIGSVGMDYQNGDYPWRQFQDGVWYRANRDTFRAQRKSHLMYDRRSTPLRVLSRILDRYPVLSILITAITSQHPWLIRGWVWAGKHSDHEAVVVAQRLTHIEWHLTGSRFIRDIRDWGNETTRTGFA